LHPKGLPAVGVHTALDHSARPPFFRCAISWALLPCGLRKTVASGDEWKYPTTFRGAFFPFLYRSVSHKGHLVLFVCSLRYMMQSLMHAWYFLYGKSRGHMILSVSSRLLGHVFPTGMRSIQSSSMSSTLVSVHPCFAFILRTSRATFKQDSSNL
jgi:hypothetical protein